MKAKPTRFTLRADQSKQQKACHGYLFNFWNWPLRSEPPLDFQFWTRPKKSGGEDTPTGGSPSQVLWLVTVQTFRQAKFDSSTSTGFGENLCCRINQASGFSLPKLSLTNINASEIELPKLAKLSKHLARWNIGWQFYLLKTKPYENHRRNVSLVLSVHGTNSWSYKHQDYY